MAKQTDEDLQRAAWRASVALAEANLANKVGGFVASATTTAVAAVEVAEAVVVAVEEVVAPVLPE